MRERLDVGRLRLARDDEAPPAVAGEVAGHGLDPLPRQLIAGRRRRARDACGSRERARQRRDVGGTEREAMVGLRARRRECALGDVETVHGRSGAPPGRELPHVCEVRRPAAEEVGVERDDDVRVREAIERPHVLAEGGEGSGADRVRRRRLPLMPARFGVLLEDGAELRAERR